MQGGVKKKGSKKSSKKKGTKKSQKGDAHPGCPQQLNQDPDKQNQSATKGQIIAA